MRALIALVLVLTALAGCVDSPDLDPTNGTSGGPDSPVTLQETFRGIVLSANTPAIMISPDQAGDVERWFYVHEDTTNLTLDLRTNEFDLYMNVFGPGCHDWDCAIEVETQDREATLVIDDPVAGPWEVVFFLRETGAEEVYYELVVTKDQAYMHEPEFEVYDGSVVALHLGAIRISPDQLGDVFQEFWVHEGTELVTIDLTSSEDVYFVVGQSFPSRDRASEQGFDTEGGSLSLTFDAPRAGGWYFIVFHETDGPGVAQPDYTVEITKWQDPPQDAGATDDAE